jgi:hypothetical protein
MKSLAAAGLFFCSGIIFHVQDGVLNVENDEDKNFKLLLDYNKRVFIGMYGFQTQHNGSDDQQRRNSGTDRTDIQSVILHLQKWPLHVQ